MKAIYVLSAVSLVAALNCNPVYADAFSQTNLVSDVSGMAPVIDPNLVDPWGMSFGPTTPIWVSDRATGVSTVYTGAGVAAPIKVTTPPGPPNGPTGQVFNSAGVGNFVLGNGAPANFIFDTLGGTIDAWNGPLGTMGTAVVPVTTSGARYEGLALANSTLYAANFVSGGGINAFDSSFAATLPGKFVDTSIPAGYAPFNVQNINGKLYVTYAQVAAGTPVPLPGNGGFVDVFDTNGNLLQSKLISNGMLDAPWGVAIAPSTWGSLAGALLVGNFGNGEINAYDPANGTWLGTLTLSNGSAFSEPGLWAIAFGNGSNSASTNSLYFNVGLNGGTDGLFGHLDPVPEPASWLLLAAGVASLAVLRLKRVVKPQ